MKEDDPTVLENERSPVRRTNAEHQGSTMPSASHQGGAWTPLKEEASRSTRTPSTPIDSDLDAITSPMQHLMATEEGTNKIRQSDDHDPDVMDHRTPQKQRRNLLLMVLGCVVLVVIAAAVVIPVLLLVVNGDKNSSNSSSASATNDPPVSVPVAVSPVSTNTSTASDAPSSMPNASNDTTDTSSDAPTMFSNMNRTATPSVSPLFISSPTVSNNTSNNTINSTTIAPTSLSVSTLVPTAVPTLAPMTTTATSTPMASSISQENAAIVLPILQTFLASDDYNAVTTMSSTTSVYAQSYEYMISSDTYLASATFADGQVFQRYILIVLNYILKQASTSTQIAIRVNPGSDHCVWIGIVCNTNTTDSLPDGLVTDLVWAELRLQGTIPTTLQYLSSLTKLDFGTNELTGTIPDVLYTNLTSLEYLFLHDNQLQGTLSNAGLAQLSNLKYLFLNDNRFTGPLPQNLGSPSTSAAAVRPLQWLNLYNNSFVGSIPLNWNLRKIFLLDLGRNQLTGSIPADWVNDMFDLKILYLNHNKLSGSFPVNFPLIGNNRLWLLQVNDNQLTGVIPGGYNERQLDLTEYQNNLFSSMDTTMCANIVWVGGEMISMRSDCGATCPCEYYCGANQCY